MPVPVCEQRHLCVPCILCIQHYPAWGYGWVWYLPWLLVLPCVTICWRSHHSLGGTSWFIRWFDSVLYSLLQQCLLVCHVICWGTGLGLCSFCFHPISGILMLTNNLGQLLCWLILCPLSSTSISAKHFFVLSKTLHRLCSHNYCWILVVIWGCCSKCCLHSGNQRRCCPISRAFIFLRCFVSLCHDWLILRSIFCCWCAGWLFGLFWLACHWFSTCCWSCFISCLSFSA